MAGLVLTVDRLGQSSTRCWTRQPLSTSAQSCLVSQISSPTCHFSLVDIDLLTGSEFSNEYLTPWKLVLFAICILLFRRLPAMLVLYRFIPAVDGFQEGLFTGWYAYETRSSDCVRGDSHVLCPAGSARLAFRRSITPSSLARTSPRTGPPCTRSFSQSSSLWL